MQSGLSTAKLSFCTDMPKLTVFLQPHCFKLETHRKANCFIISKYFKPSKLTHEEIVKQKIFLKSKG